MSEVLEAVVDLCNNEDVTVASDVTCTARVRFELYLRNSKDRVWPGRYIAF